MIKDLENDLSAGPLEFGYDYDEVGKKVVLGKGMLFMPQGKMFSILF